MEFLSLVRRTDRGCEGECRGCGVREKQKSKENDRLMEKGREQKQREEEEEEEDGSLPL